MNLLCVVLATSALEHQLFCIGFGSWPVQTMAKSFGNKGLGRGMMPTLPLVDLPKDLQTFLWLDAALKNCGCASVVHFAVDDGVGFGPPHNAPSFGLVTRLGNL